MTLKIEPQFRIGGIYRQRDGKLVRLVAGRSLYPDHQDVDAWDASGWAFAAIVGTRADQDGARFLSSGRYVHAPEEAERACVLIPGELDESGNPITPASAAVAPAPIPAPQAEPKHPPLDWNKPTRVDRFPGFVVERSGESTEQVQGCGVTHSPDLQPSDAITLMGHALAAGSASNG